MPSRTCLANIFPGDMFDKNFGVTRPVASCSTTTTRSAISPSATSAEFRRHARRRRSWRPTVVFGRSDEMCFPEEFSTYLLGEPRVREVFMSTTRTCRTGCVAGEATARARWQYRERISVSARDPLSQPVRTGSRPAAGSAHRIEVLTKATGALSPLRRPRIRAKRPPSRRFCLQPFVQRQRQELTE